MKVALIHDWFNDIGGAEKVAHEILVCYPEADVFCVMDFYKEKTRKKYLLNKSTKTTFIQKLPFSKRFYRFLFPLFPRAIESLDVSSYDVLISSSSSVAKGVKKTVGQLHICYCHSPMRYAWDLKKEYLDVTRNRVSRALLNYFLNRLKKWDLKTNKGVDFFIANSEYVKCRIQKNYSRQAQVIYPPVHTERFSANTKKQNYYFTASRLVSYKKTEQIVRAFAKLPDLKLQVAGTGPIIDKLKRIATSNVEFLGFIPTVQLSEKIRNAKAFIVNANEDFGITVVEAQACATPILAPNLGGYKETVTEKTGIFFESQHWKDILKAIQQFESNQKEFHAEDFVENVKKFDRLRFHTQFKEFTEEHYRAFKKP